MHSREGMLQCLEAGSACRTTGSTLMNEQSSRSHSLFTVLANHPSPHPHRSPLTAHLSPFTLTLTSLGYDGWTRPATPVRERADAPA